MRFNAFLRDVNMDASKSSPKTCQLPVDVTLRCVCVWLSSSGEPHPSTADADGVVLSDKGTTYPELTTSRKCRLVVFAIETGGRWSD